MPLLRYLVVVGGLLLGCFWALDAMNGPAAPRARQDTASLDAWRAAEARKGVTRPDREAAAVVMPDIATLPPTPERLSYERQLASNVIPAPVIASEPREEIANARAQMAEATPKPSKPVAQVKPKAKRKPAVAVASSRPQRNPEFAGSFFGGIFSN